MKVYGIAGRVAMALVLVSAIAGFAAPVAAQWFGGGGMGGNQQWGGNYGGNSGWGNSSWGHQSRRVPIQGNWFEMKSTPGHFDSHTEKWIPGNTSIQPNVANILNDVGKAIVTGNQSHHDGFHRPPRPHHHHSHNHHHHQNHHFSRPQYHHDSAPLPAPTRVTHNTVPSSKPAAPVVKNKVVKKTEPAENALRFHGYGEMASAETDAQQVIVASELEGRAQVATEADVAAALANGAPDEMRDDWADYVNDPSVEKLEAFKQKWGDELDQRVGPSAVENLDLQIKIGEYKQDLLDGRLTGAGKDRAIAEIQESIEGLTNPDTKKALQNKADQLQDLNNLGKLAEATQHDPGGLVTLMQGAASAGYSPSFVGEMIGTPIMDVPPVADGSGEAVSGDAYLFNPDDNEGSVHYTLDGKTHEMEPGESRTWTAGSTIRFDNGQGTTKKYTMSDASYKFVVIDDAWDLRRATFKVTIDNSEYPADFHYVLDNERGVVKAGQTKTIQSAYPIDLIFDRGDESEPARKRLLAGSYKVGLDASKTRVDLFDEQVIAEGPAADILIAENPRAAAAARRAQLVQEKLRSKTRVSAAGNVAQLLEALKGNEGL